MSPQNISIVQVKDLRKSYASGFEALKGVTLDIREGEIIALLGRNGAGKTTLISTICGINRPTAGQVQVGGFDVVKDYRAARALIGLVPQELNLEAFETVFCRRVVFTRVFRETARSGSSGTDFAVAFPLGQERHQDHGPFGRDETAGADAQGTCP